MKERGVKIAHIKRALSLGLLYFDSCYQNTVYVNNFAQQSVLIVAVNAAKYIATAVVKNRGEFFSNIKRGQRYIRL